MQGTRKLRRQAKRYSKKQQSSPFPWLQVFAWPDGRVAPPFSLAQDMGSGVSSGLGEQYKSPCRHQNLQRSPALCFLTVQAIVLLILLLIFLGYECITCRHVSAPVSSNVCGGQKRESDPVELELQMVVSQHVDAEN